MKWTGHEFDHLKEGRRVRAKARVYDLPGNPAPGPVHAEPGDEGVVVHAEPGTWPTVAFDRTGTSTCVTPDEVEALDSEPSAPGPRTLEAYREIQEDGRKDVAAHLALLKKREGELTEAFSDSLRWMAVAFMHARRGRSCLCDACLWADAHAPEFGRSKKEA